MKLKSPLNKLFTLAIVSNLLLCSAFAESIKEKHLQGYITHNLDHLFFPNHGSKELTQLAKEIARTITSSNNYESEWSWNSFSYHTTYAQDYVEQVILGATLEFIKAASFKYAREFANKDSAQQIANYVYDILFGYCAQATYLERGVFAKYIGYSLQTIVQDLYHYLPPVQQAPAASTHAVYPSDACCVCMESFNDVTRIYLTPCGHDMCIHCAQHWFFAENKGNCPLCRQKVDKKLLRQALDQAFYAAAAYAPSAPPFFS